jgi:DNA-binding Xre family transcriptional regulator
LIRKKKGLIQKQVGGNKIPASIISRIENGKFIPKVSMLETICKSLGCKSSDILPF